MPPRRARKNPVHYAIDFEKLVPTIKETVAQVLHSHHIDIPKNIQDEIARNTAQALIAEADDEIVT